jgi:glycine cleavage system regulatory protein
MIEFNVDKGETVSVSLVLTLIGEDKPGLVEMLSQAIVAHEGNWLESRMSRMAGRFAGILRASVPTARADELIEVLRGLESRGLRVVVERSEYDDTSTAFRRFSFDLVGSDRAGIIRDISRALASRGVNVDELHTECTSAPMSGESLFSARAKLRIPEGSEVEELRLAIESIANDLMVDFTLSDVADTDD